MSAFLQIPLAGEPILLVVEEEVQIRDETLVVVAEAT
jgi:hypothetical protein